MRVDPEGAPAPNAGEHQEGLGGMEVVDCEWPHRRGDLPKPRQIVSVRESRGVQLAAETVRALPVEPAIAGKEKSGLESRIFQLLADEFDDRSFRTADRSAPKTMKHAEGFGRRGKVSGAHAVAFG